MVLNYDVRKEDFDLEKFYPRQRPGKYLEALMEFMDSGEDVAELTEFSAKTTSLIIYMREVIKKAGIKNVIISNKRGRVFLIRKEG